jgi:hypothetical protein
VMAELEGGVDQDSFHALLVLMAGTVPGRCLNIAL